VFPVPAGAVRRGTYEEPQAMKVDRRDGETVEQLLRRFNKVVIAERITKTFREKMHFVSKSEQRKEKRRRAERNRRKKAMSQGH
jgi:small subunit ribosomal protein S21